MVLQNTTFVISEKVEKEFFHWLRTAFISAAKVSGVYEEGHKFMLILTPPEPGTKNFAFQLKSDNLDNAEQWICAGDGAKLLREITHRLDGQMAHFTTFMAELDI